MGHGQPLGVGWGNLGYPEPPPEARSSGSVGDHTGASVEVEVKRPW